jgi:hypothetical protein
MASLHQAIQSILKFGVSSFATVIYRIGIDSAFLIA